MIQNFFKSVKIQQIRKFFSTKIVKKEKINDEMDEQLDLIIDQKLNEGLDQEQILNELKYGKIALKSNVQPTATEKLSMKDLIFNPQKILNQEQDQKQKFDEDQFDREFEQIEKMQEILKNNQNKQPISEMPLSFYMNENRKLTKNEKADIQFNLKILESNIMKDPDTQLNKKELLKDTNYPVKDINTQKTSMETQKKQKFKSQIQNMDAQQILTKKIDSLQMMDEIASDAQFKNLGITDSDNQAQKMGTYIAPDKKGDSKIKRIGQRQDTWVQAFQNKDHFIKKYNLETDDQIELFQQYDKEKLFNEKKIQEENIEYQNYLKRKERMKSIKKLKEEIDEIQYDSDIDYKDDTKNFQTISKKKKDPYLSGMPHLDKLQLLEKQQQEMSILEGRWDWHRKRTIRNIQDYLQRTFTSQNQSKIILQE